MDMIDIAAVHAIVAAPRDAALDPARALDFVSHEEFGGQALFVGRVRRYNHGRDVVAVEYDLFEPLARTMFTTSVMRVMIWTFVSPLGIGWVQMRQPGCMLRISCEVLPS